MRKWIRFNAREAARTRDGLYGPVLGIPRVPRRLGELLMPLATSAERQSRKDTADIRSSGAIAVVFADADDPSHWIDAGRCVERLSLEATVLGLRTAFINQPVEVSELRPQFAAFLGIGERRPDLVLRIIALSPLLADYTWLGIEHILGGFDHLFFVIALAFLVTRRRALLGAITAFTLAHSLTLAVTALEVVQVPAAPVEAMITLPVVLVCAECVRPGDSLTRRAPWLVAFAFGLLHGLGFASALLDIGLPQRHLLSFNVGVELGQLAVIGAVVGLRALATRLRVRRAWMARALVYAMGSLAAFWSLDRVLAG